MGTYRGERYVPMDLSMRRALESFGLLHEVGVGLGHFQAAFTFLPTGAPVAVRIDTRQ